MEMSETGTPPSLCKQIQFGLPWMESALVSVERYIINQQ
jgi:hypothetical protein